jgi:opacity protein-like surface antigen
MSVRRSCAVTSLAVAIAFAAASPLSAQGGGPERSALALGLLAGATLPVGDFGDDAKVGYHAGAFVAWHSTTFPIGVRGDFQYHRNDLKLEFLNDVTPLPVEVESGHSTITMAGAALEVGLVPMSAPVRPFLLVGAAHYSAKVAVDVEGREVSDTENTIGFNFGGGLRFRVGKASVFVESRFHSFKVETTDIEDEDFEVTFQFVPVSFGFSF